MPQTVQPTSDSVSTRLPATIVVATHARPALLEDCAGVIAATMSAGDECLVLSCCASAT